MTQEQDTNIRKHICLGDAAKHIRHSIIISVHATVYLKLLIREMKHAEADRTSSVEVVKNRMKKGGKREKECESHEAAVRINPSHFLQTFINSMQIGFPANIHVIRQFW